MQNLLKSLFEKIWPEDNSDRGDVIAKNKVLVGKIGGKDAYLTFLYRHTNFWYDEDYIVFNVVFGHSEIKNRYTQELVDFKQFKTDFVLINEDDVRNKQCDYMQYDSVNNNLITSVLDIDFFDNYEELIYQECSKEESIELSKKIFDMEEQHRNIRESFLENLKYRTEYDFLEELYKKGRYDERLEKKFIKYNQMTEEEYQREVEEKKCLNDTDFSAIADKVLNRIFKQN
jgi:hypothetical protein